jgi:peptidylprolyl isomerase
VLQKGRGPQHPTVKDSLEVHYTGWTPDGKMFDSSVARGQPAKIVLRAMMKGWQQGLPMMVVGEKRRFWIPAALAFGDKTLRPDWPGGPVVYDIELLGIFSPPPAIEAPADARTPPRAATVTRSGLAHLLLRKGAGSVRPGPQSVVIVQYDAWTSEGKLFDSTRRSGAPLRIPVGQSMPGWEEGLKLMTAGEKRRFWIPPKLAHGDPPSKAGYPAGTTVFDLELVGIEGKAEREEED